METTVLLVEDDDNLSFILAENLEIEGFNVLQTKKGENVLPILKQYEVDIILLDIDLAGAINGFEVAEDVRRYYPTLPIIFTTGKSHFRDTERGLKLGFVDYQKKPYGARELMARISNLLNRSEGKQEHNQVSSAYIFRGFSFNPTDHALHIDGTETRLTKTEATFLSVLCESMNKVVSKENVISHLWGKDDIPRDHSLNNLSHRIRKYLEGNNYVELTTISKVGYRLMEKK